MTRTVIAGGDPVAAITGRGAFSTSPGAIAMKIFAVVVTAMLKRDHGNNRLAAAKSAAQATDAAPEPARSSACRSLIIGAGSH